MVTGATFSFTAHFPYILEQAETFSVADSSTQPQAQLSVNNNGKQDINSTKVALTNNKSTDLMVITSQEQDQIIQMLVSLGMQQSDNYQELIRDFQARNKLTPTGSLDSLTLNTLINQVQLEKAAALVN